MNLDVCCIKLTLEKTARWMHHNRDNHIRNEPDLTMEC